MKAFERRQPGKPEAAAETALVACSPSACCPVESGFLLSSPAEDHSRDLIKATEQQLGKSQQEVTTECLMSHASMHCCRSSGARRQQEALCQSRRPGPCPTGVEVGLLNGHNNSWNRHLSALPPTTPSTKPGCPFLLQGAPSRELPRAYSL